MRTTSHSRLLLLLLPVLYGASALAQAPATAGDDCGQPDCTTSSPDLSSDHSGDSNSVPAPEIYAASLDGRGPIALTGVPGKVLFGLDLSTGWDSNPNSGNRPVGSRFFILSPYVGIRAATPKTQALLQYDLTAAQYNGNYASQVLHSSSARYLHLISERWSLDVDGAASYGTNSARFLGAQQSLIGGSVQGAGTDAAAYLGDDGNVTNISADFGADYRVSPTDTLDIRVTNGFTRFSGRNQSNSILTENLSFSRDLSAATAVSAYAQISQYYGSLSCDSFGFGLSLRWQLNNSTSLSASGGPQLDAPNCGAQQGASYHVTLTRQLTGRSELYFLSKREPGTSYLGPGLWQDSASAGYAHQIARSGTLRFNLAYLHSLGLNGSQSYNPLYVDTAYSYDMNRTLHASFGYRAFSDLSGGANGSRNVAYFSLGWSPGRTVTDSR